MNQNILEHADFTVVVLDFKLEAGNGRSFGSATWRPHCGQMSCPLGQEPVRHPLQY